MFYSQTFLARKGPLGTVWCAAHLQHRLKKSHYTSTDISSTVDHIMFPEVPIALRMSGHLLLGVVRIYSKKVDYLYHDCNVVLIGLRKAFASSEVNLPEHATTAKFESVTLPQIVDLDALDVDRDIDPDGFLDIHMRSQEEITLQDQIPINRDPYVVVTFDEDMMDILQPEQDPNSGVRPMEDILLRPGIDNNVAPPNSNPSNQMEIPAGTVLQDLGPSNQREELMDTVVPEELDLSNKLELQTETMDFQDPGASNQTQVLNTALNDDHSPPEIEVMRDQVPDFRQENPPPVFTDHQSDVSIPNRSLDQGLDEKEIPSPFNEGTLPSGGQSSAFQPRSGSSNFFRTQEAPEIFDTHGSFGHISPELEMRSSPPVQQPRLRQRKRKHFFDKSTVLTNKFMKKALENSNDILRKRREIPCTALGIWKMNNTLRKEQVFCDSSLTGSCADICNILKKDYISRTHLILERGVTPEPRVVTPPAPETEATHELNDATSPAPAAEVIQEAGDATSPPSATEVFLDPRTATCRAPATEEISEPTSRQSSVPEAEPDPEIERFRHCEGHDGNNVLQDVLPSPGRFVSSSFRRDDFTPHSPKSLVSEVVTWAGTSAGMSVLHTPDVAASTGTYVTETETPRTFLEEEFDAGYTGLSDIPESVDIAETEDLSFLEADNSLAGSQGTQGVESLSMRTRAAAQYLMRHSPTTLILEDEPGHLSLNKILQGKTKKICARMFFEMLVLKSYGLIDVRQEQPYSDIALKLTSTLAKSQI